MAKTIRHWKQRTLDSSVINISASKYDENQPDTLLWCPTCQEYILKHNSEKHPQSRQRRYVGVDDLSNKREILSKAREIAQWGLQDWEHRENVSEGAEISTVYIVGSFKQGLADPPISDIDIAAHLRADAEKLNIDRETLSVILETNVYPQRTHEIEELVEYNIRGADIFIT